MQNYEDSTEDEKPSTNVKDISRVARYILKATPSASEVDEPVAGPSRPRVPSPVRYSVCNNCSTYIHGHAPIMSPQVLVCCLPFAPCPPFRSSSPIPMRKVAEPLPTVLLLPVHPQGGVYLHPPPQPFIMRPLVPLRQPRHSPTPHPPSSPPPVPRLEVYQQAPLPEPAVHCCSSCSCGFSSSKPIPWLIGLLQGPHQAVSATLLQQYLALLEYMLDNYM